MIEFAKSFFEDEIRDGFYIKNDMKRIWAAQMEILMEIDRICRKYHLSYFADFGTLLGAVRHNGFIPWDDDLDIVMLRDDYMKFLGVVGEELKEPMRCSNIYKAKRWSQPFARVANGVGINLDRCFLNQFHGCVYSAGVDIFVLDNLPDSEDEFYMIGALYALTQRTKAGMTRREENAGGEGDSLMTEEEINDLLCNVEEMCDIKIDREKNIQNQLLRIIDGLGALNMNNQSKELFDISFVSHSNYFYAGYKREWYKEAILLPFENIAIPVPVGFHKVLELEFGNYRQAVKIFEHGLYSGLEEKLQAIRKDIKNINKKIERLNNL